MTIFKNINFSMLTLLTKRKSLFLTSKCLSTNIFSVRNFCAVTLASQGQSTFSWSKYRYYLRTSIFHTQWYCKSTSSKVLSDLQNDSADVKTVFPNPRVTLYEFASRRPEKIFDIIYKQQTVAPKGSKKSKIAHTNDWTCIYAFVWPEKIVFESTAISKKQAAEKAANSALQWLYTNGRIDRNGMPVVDRSVIQDLQKTLNDPIRMEISDKSMERITRIMDDYENGIKEQYEKTHKEALRGIVQPLALTKDSTIDEEEELTDEEIDDTSEVFHLPEENRRFHPVYSRYITEPSQISLDRRENVLKRKFEAYCDAIVPLPIDEYSYKPSRYSAPFRPIFHRDTMAAQPVAATNKMYTVLRNQADTREEITSALESSRALVLVGSAGCGKSTRAPPAVLKACGANARVLVSEPRRVAAIDLARRVASDFGEDVGDTVGYQVRLHSLPPRPPGGSILYCTSGVLLRRLQQNPGLEGCSHVFIDEAHERDVNTDITLSLLKRALKLNPEIRVVIMSATLNTDVFTSYFDDCPIMEVPGRAYPVAVSYLEDLPEIFDNLTLPNTLENCRRVDSKPQIDCQEVFEVIVAVDAHQPEGAILVFLPGWAEIKSVKKLLDEKFKHSSTHIILPVHSRLSTEDQIKMFTKPLPGVRKIVLSTNIAETSITIQDVVYVIDTGAHKENRIKEGTGTASLEMVWVSQAAAKQRTGRAGRVQPGHCYKLYTMSKEEEFAPYITPEILRVPLEQTVLNCKTYAPDDKVADFFSELPEPPSGRALTLAVEDLVDLGALSMPGETLTSLGRILSHFTVHPRLGCALVYSAVFGNMISVSNIVAQLSANVEIFENAMDRRQEIRDIKRKVNEVSDHVALHLIQDQYTQLTQTDKYKGVDRLCAKYGMRKDRLKYVTDLSNLHLRQALQSGIVASDPDPQDLSRFSDLDELSKATLTAASNSLLVTRRHLKGKGRMAIAKGLFTSTGDRAHIGSESVNHSLCKNRPGAQTDILCYFGGYHSTERRALVLHKTSLITPHTAFLFCKGHVVREDLDDNAGTVLTMPRHRLKITVPAKQADSLMNLKDILWKTLQYYTERDTRNLDFEVDDSVSRFKTRLVKTVGRILVEAEKEYFEDKKNVNVNEN